MEAANNLMVVWEELSQVLPITIRVCTVSEVRGLFCVDVFAPEKWQWSDVWGQVESEDLLLTYIPSFFLPWVVIANELTDVFVEVLSAAVNRFNSYNWLLRC